MLESSVVGAMEHHDNCHHFRSCKFWCASSFWFI